MKPEIERMNREYTNMVRGSMEKDNIILELEKNIKRLKA